MQNYKLKKKLKNEFMLTQCWLQAGTHYHMHWNKIKKTAAALPFFRKCGATKFVTNSGCNVLY